MKLFLHSTRKERESEIRHIRSLEERYLRADVIDKVERDDGYRKKVEQIEHELGTSGGWVLDIGSNTCGECEYLNHRGHAVIATDVNDLALSISRRRCESFGRRAPAYVVCDGQNLPFRDRSIASVVYCESLHHMPDPAKSLAEARRVLNDDGAAILYEPYAYDPWRRLSEIRDYFRGFVETSFSEGRIHALARGAGLRIAHLSRPVLPPSTWKMKFLPGYARALRQLYFRARSTAPRIFGMILAVARKA
jgi:ubiquinone/menaquinone biosynthesis C-methylase UbiE